MDTKKRHSRRKCRRAVCGVLLIWLIIGVMSLYKVMAPEDMKTRSSDNAGVQQDDQTAADGEISALEASTGNISDWKLILVNFQNKIPEGFSVKLKDLENGHAIDESVYPDLQDMLEAARAEGLYPLICSSYRTNEKQEKLYNNKVNEYLTQGYSQEEAETEAKKWVAVPGTSEHQTGLAVDIVDINYQLLDRKQETTDVQKWLMENSYKYGFILRYPQDKSEVTGICYEPWHYRYVGKEAAKEIYEKEICLEEYLDGIKGVDF